MKKENINSSLVFLRWFFKLFYILKVNQGNGYEVNVNCIETICFNGADLFKVY